MKADKVDETTIFRLQQENENLRQMIFSLFARENFVGWFNPEEGLLRPVRPEDQLTALALRARREVL